MIAAFANEMAQWPNILIVLAFSAVMVALLGVARSVGRHLLPTCGEEERSAALDTFKVLGSLTGLFLSFSLVQSMGEFRDANAEVSREAINLYQLDRALADVPGPDSQATRRALRDYAHHVVTGEWTAMQRGSDEDHATTEAMARLQGAVEALIAGLPADQRMTNDIDKNFDDVQDDRARRIASAHGGLPAIMWRVMAMLLALLLVAAAWLQGPARRNPLPVFYMAGLGLLAALLFIFDRPFQGELSVSPAPIIKVLAQLDARLH